MTYNVIVNPMEQNINWKTKGIRNGCPQQYERII